MSVSDVARFSAIDAFSIRLLSKIHQAANYRPNPDRCFCNECFHDFMLLRGAHLPVGQKCSPSSEGTRPSEEVETSRTSECSIGRYRSRLPTAEINRVHCGGSMKRRSVNVSDRDLFTVWPDSESTSTQM